MAKKKTALTIEERLQQALVPANEQPYDVPENWVWCRLGSVAEILNGDRGKNYPSKSTLSKEGIPFISAANLSNNTVVNDDLMCMSDEQYDKLSAGKLRKNDIVLCIRGSLGKHGKFPYDKGAIASSLVILRSKDNNILLDDYEMLYLDVPLFYDEIKKYDNGTAQPNLAAKNLELFIVPIPPLLEQQRIIKRIEELFSKLDEAKEILQEVVDGFDVRKAAILHKAFTGELTKKWREENGISDDSWVEKTIGEFAEVKGGKRLPKGHQLTVEKTEHPYLRIADFGENTIDMSDLHYISDDTFSLISRYIITKDDVYISIVGTIGKSGTIPEILDGANLTENAARIISRVTIPAYLNYFLQSPNTQNDIQDRIRSATLGKLSLLNIKAILVPIPTFPEQYEIVRLLDALLARERKAQQAAKEALANIELMKKAVLARAFRGELGTNREEEASALALLKEVLE